MINTEKKLKKIIGADNVKLKEFKQKFDSCGISFDFEDCTAGNGCGNCIPCRNNAEKISFREKILKALDYENNGKASLRKVYSRLGLKTCYVCNAQYALNAVPENRPAKGTVAVQDRYKAKFQFDHYLPKAKYPALSISLFNLFPICSPCNSIKGERDLGIDFLSSDPNDWDDKFTFKILEKSLTAFLLNQKAMKIDFIDKTTYIGMESLAKRFDIKGIYNNQIDLIEELIIRKLKYSDTYKGKLTQSFPNLFHKTSIDERIELGTYSQNEGIHKRPMSKFIHDIDQQLTDHFQKELLKIGN
ncbi:MULTISPECIES: hypothetical protein [Flavobacterium]|uniref:hypothetical protein n=1 Tax=Flavobacterium TaxID=237 RepID=UPI0024807791|nr:hypothetical protein [Flavobacterium gelatinilyticum]